MFLEHSTREFLDFTEGDRFEAARTLQAQREAAYAAEEIENLELRHIRLVEKIPHLRGSCGDRRYGPPGECQL